MGFYGHALHAAFGQPEAAGSVGKALLGPLLRDAKCMAATLFFAVFGAVIALMKVRACGWVGVGGWAGG